MSSALLRPVKHPTLKLPFLITTSQEWIVISMVARGLEFLYQITFLLKGPSDLHSEGMPIDLNKASIWGGLTQGSVVVCAIIK